MATHDLGSGGLVYRQIVNSVDWALSDEPIISARACLAPFWVNWAMSLKTLIPLSTRFWTTINPQIVSQLLSWGRMLRKRCDRKDSKQTQVLWAYHQLIVGRYFPFIGPYIIPYIMKPHDIPHISCPRPPWHKYGHNRLYIMAPPNTTVMPPSVCDTSEWLESFGLT